MKGSDKVEMTLNIGGEIIKLLDVEFDDQDNVRNAERAVKQYIQRRRANTPDLTDRELLALAAYEFAKSYHHLLKIQEEAIELAHQKTAQIDNFDHALVSESVS